jgi:16S rRNA (uracil1498-N3)-methyltransferase
MSERFYLNLPLARGPIELTGPEAHHLATVCRLHPGDTVILFNGDGCEYPALIQAVGRRAVQLDIFAGQEPMCELQFTLEVAAPLPKGDRGQFLIEKLTELGVTRFVPLLCTRSVIQPREGKLEKLQRYVIEASKQCGRNCLMHIHELVKWEAYCRSGTSGEMRIMGHRGGPHCLAGPENPSATAIRLAVGPEGGFTEPEVALAKEAGWLLVDLGPRILRIETAALVLAVQAITMRNQ